MVQLLWGRRSELGMIVMSMQNCTDGRAAEFSFGSWSAFRNSEIYGVTHFEGSRNRPLQSLIFCRFLQALQQGDGQAASNGLNAPLTHTLDSTCTLSGISYMSKVAFSKEIDPIFVDSFGRSLKSPHCLPTYGVYAWSTAGLEADRGVPGHQEANTSAVGSSNKCQSKPTDSSWSSSNQFGLFGGTHGGHFSITSMGIPGGRFTEALKSHKKS